MTHRKTFQRSGFSLIEMLTVIVIITLLMATAASSLSKARMLAKKAKAESELREMVNAFQQYVSLYGEENLTEGDEQIVTDTLLKPLLPDGASGVNKLNITFLNVNLLDGESEYKDPWGQPYKISIGKNETDKHKVVMRTSIAFPNADNRVYE